MDEQVQTVEKKEEILPHEHDGKGGTKEVPPEGVKVVENLMPQPPVPPELYAIKRLFESTITFFKMINKVMVDLGYSRQKRRQVFDSLIKGCTLSDTDIVACLMAELKPVFDDAKLKVEVNKPKVEEK